MKELDSLFDAFEKRMEKDAVKEEQDRQDYQGRRAQGEKVLKEVILPVLKDAEKTVSDKGYVVILEDKIEHWDMPYVKFGFDAIKADKGSPTSFLSFFYLDDHVIQVNRTSNLQCFSDAPETIMPLQMYNEELVKDLVRYFVGRILQNTN